MNLKSTKLAAAVGMLVLSGTSFAADSGSGTLAVSATVAVGCAVSQNAAIAFGTLSPTGTLVKDGSISATCTTGTGSPKFRYVSANVGAGTDFKLLGGASDYIVYTLHQDATGTLGAVTHGADNVHPDFSADGTSKTLNLSAKITQAARAAAPAQAYADTITITTSYTP